MQKLSEVFKSNYYQRVAQKKSSQKNVLLDFQISPFLLVGLFRIQYTYYRTTVEFH
jgi:hypothetical protein